MQKAIILLFVALFSISGFSQSISGKWSGIIETGKKEPVVFNFTIEKNEENYTTVIDIPAMRVAALKPKLTTFTNGALLVDGSNLGFKYEGTFIQRNEQIEGTFTEGVNALK